MDKPNDVPDSDEDMQSLKSIAEIEGMYTGPQGSPLLGTAFTMLRTRWSEGARDRETALRLAFLAWYSCSEPSYNTGLPDDDGTPLIFSEAFSSLGGTDSTDPEVCYVFGIMAELFPYCCGNEKHWAAIGAKLTERSKIFLPQGLSPDKFFGRGAYGEYFAHMASNDKEGKGGGI